MLSKRFEMAKDALYNAFFNGTLAKFNCAACAVGNIVGHANGCSLTEKELKIMIDDPRYIIDYSRYWEISRKWKTIFTSGEGPTTTYMLNEVANTGYTGQELSEIERAFEENTKIKFLDYKIRTEQEVLEDQYNGLCAVFDVLLKLEGETSEKENNYKSHLKTHPKLCLQQ